MLFPIIQETLPLFLNHADALAYMNRILELARKMLQSSTTVQE